MVSSRKRGRQEMEAIETSKAPPMEPSLLERIRNMWEFANLVQYIFTFGSAVKIDDNMDIEDLEMECLKSQSIVLPEIGLALLKFVSSHRGLTPEIFDEYTRRQYIAKAPSRNPFGEDEVPARFADFDIFTKIRVLQQLSQWTFGNPDRIREKMPEQKDSEQTIWRIEPFGWDSEDRTYFVLDDNRLYRRTDPPPPPAPTVKPKKNSKKAKAALRASKRRRVSAAVDSDAELGDDSLLEEQEKNDDQQNTFGGMKWECIAVSLEDFNNFLATINRSRDPNEKQLQKRITDDILPLLQKQEESRKRKAVQKERELLNLEKLATAKRSSRIAGRQEQQKHEEEAREAERKRQAELEMAKKEQEKWMKLEKERESRMMTREQRLKEREARRILHEEELANLSEDSKKLETGSGRLSERHLKAEIEKKKRALEELAEDDDWIFDCICGAYGKIDDGTHSIACDKCNIWQHSKCVGVSQSAAEREDFYFICQICTRRAEDAERAKTQPPIKIKIQRPGSSSSAVTPRQKAENTISSPPTRSHGYENGSPRAVASPQKSQSTQPISSVPATALFRPSVGSSLGTTPSRSPNMGTFTGMFKLSGTSPSSASHMQTAPGAQSSSSPKKQSSRSSFPLGEASVVGPNMSQTRQQSPYVLASPAQRDTPSMANGHHLPNSQSSPQSADLMNGSFNEKAQTQHQSAIGATGILTNEHQEYYSNGPIQRSRPPSAGGTQAMPPTPQNSNGQRVGMNGTAPRRSSVSTTSPLAGAPILTPMNKPAMSFSGNGSPVPNFTPSAQLSKVSPHPLSSPSAAPQMTADQDPGHASALPPASTGISPTKQTPPTPKVDPLNGGLGPVTPSVIPPVASLSPSPQLQNLSPPVKHAEPERSSKSSQDASQ